MTNHARLDEFDSLMADWFDRDTQVRPPEHLLAATLARTARTRPLPAWRLPERWLPLATLAIRRPAVPRGAYLLIVIALLVVAVAAALILTVGTHKLPAPLGPAANGRIAYISGGQLYTASSAGTDVRQLTSGARINSAAFSNDGTRIAYLTNNMTSSTEPFLFTDLNVADADGTHARVLLANARGVSNPKWSPDGRFIAVSTAPIEKDKMMVVAVDGSGVTDLGDFGAGASAPSWSPDGKRLAMIVGADIWVVDRDGTNHQKINQGTYKQIGEDGGAVEWNPDGTLLLFGGGDQAAYYGQFIVGLDGAPERPVEPCACGGLVNDSNGNDGVWSPDGSRFAYLKAGTGTGPAVVIADRTGKTIRQLDGQYSWHMPVWSPDGTRIAIADDRPLVNNTPGPPVTVILDAVGKAAPVIIPGAGIVDSEIPSFSATWQRLAP
jgi:dipeptidyl aminopeptidase/acylaminoacyl peptidase